MDNKLSGFNTTFAQTLKKGYGVELQIGDDVLRFIDPARHTELKLIYEKVKGGQTYSHHESFNTPSGVTVYFESNYHPNRNAQNNIIGMGIFSKNITERIKADENIRSKGVTTPIIYTTGNSYQVTLKDLETMPNNHLLSKPLEFEYLIHIIGTIKTKVNGNKYKTIKNKTYKYFSTI